MVEGLPSFIQQQQTFNIVNALVYIHKYLVKVFGSEEAPAGVTVTLGFATEAMRDQALDAIYKQNMPEQARKMYGADKHLQGMNIRGMQINFVVQPVGKSVGGLVV